MRFSGLNLCLRLGIFLCVLFGSSAPLRAGDTLGIPDEPGIKSGKYIVPNEKRTYYFEPVLKGRKGVLISVGSFRTLHDFALGQFDRAIFFDYDERMTAFNRANLNLIAKSSDRFDYVARLLVRSPPEDLLVKVRAGKITEVEYVQELRERAILELRAPLTSISDPDVKVIATSLKEPLPERSQSLRLGLIAAVSNALQDSGMKPFTLAGSEAVFQKVKAAVVAGKMSVLNGSVSGDAALPALAKKLRENGETVSAIDLSNLLEHFYEDRTTHLSRLARNLEALPTNPDTIVLLTSDTTKEGLRDELAVQGNDWAVYFSMPLSEFKAALDSGKLTTDVGYQRLVKSLHAHRSQTSQDGHLAIMTASACREALAKLP